METNLFHQPQYNNRMQNKLPSCGFESLPESLSFLFFRLYFSPFSLTLSRLRSDCQVWSMLMSEPHAPRTLHSLHPPPHCLVYMVQQGVTSLLEGKNPVCVFSATVCKIQASKCYIKSLLLVLKDKRSCFSQGERSAVRLSLDCTFALRKWNSQLTFGIHL